MKQDYLSDFIERERLPHSYPETIGQWFRPLATSLAAKAKEENKALIVGINGCQGSGKSTLSAALVEILQHEQGLSSIAISLDDFYLTKAERQRLDLQVHPLLSSRGVPGTHDIALASQTIDQLLQKQSPTLIPRFNKAIDDRHLEENWTQVNEPIDIIILEGWCLGSQPQNFLELIEPINSLEREDDKDGIWRHFVNTELQKYQTLFSKVDQWIMLKAPDFSCVYQWRLEQEEKLKLKSKNSNKTDGIMSPEEIKRFIQHFQRITEHTLEEMPARVDYLFELDHQRNITLHPKNREA